MSAIDRYVDDLGARLKVTKTRRAMLLEEVRDHLLDAAEHRVVYLGEPQGVAEEEAVRRFGAPSLIARTFNAAAGGRAMRRAPVAGFFAGVTVAIAFVLAANAQPRAAHPASAAMQLLFFTGVLLFQVAVVAGGCGASRAAATWHTAAASGGDRAFVRRCTIVSMLALCGGALAVTTNMALDAYQRAHTHVVPLAAAVVAMIVAAVAGLVVASRLDVSPSDVDSQAGEAATPSVLLVGEWAIAFVRRHPVITCAVTAATATIGAMTHAEASSITAALPWGMAESATVVAAFLLLGPSLGLREGATGHSPT